MRNFALICVLAGIAVAGCSKSSTPSSESASATPEAPAAAPVQSAQPMAKPEPSIVTENAQESDSAFVGVVVSTIDIAESKTMYLELDVNGNREWVASKSIEVKAGDKVKVGAGALEMENFASSSLGRSFDKIWLASEVEKVN